MRNADSFTISVSTETGMKKNKAVSVLPVATAFSILTCVSFKAFIFLTCYGSSFGLMGSFETIAYNKRVRDNPNGPAAPFKTMAKIDSARRLCFVHL